MEMTNKLDLTVSEQELNKIYAMTKTESWKLFSNKILKSWFHTVSGMLTNTENSRETDLILKGNTQVLANLISFEEILKQQVEVSNETI